MNEELKDISQHHFSKIFEKELIEEIENVGTLLNVKAGETIINFGDLIRVIPIVLNGNIKVFRMNEEGQELLLYYIHHNESCVMSFACCMMKKHSEIKAIAEDDSTFVAIPIKYLDEWMMKYSSWKSYVMQSIQNRFTELLKTIDSMAFKKLDERLITYLNDKSKNASSAVLNLTHQQIADELATSRVVISRLLKQLENDSQLLLYRNQIKLLPVFFQQ
jgi:CRP/FNR family transcriptional regulator